MACLLFMASTISYGQISFSHSIGGSIYAATNNTSAGGIMYSPRLNILEIDDDLTLSIGTHIGAGMSFNSREGASSLALDVPVMAEVNFGFASSSNSRSDFGGFAGVGYGISRIGDQGAFGTDYNEANGIVLNAGVRGLVSNIPLGARFSYLLNSKKDGPEEYTNVYSLGIFLILK